MSNSAPNLGLCFSGKRLLYAVAAPEDSGEIRRLGCVDFSFSICDALAGSEPEAFSGISDTIARLKEEFEFGSLLMLTLPGQECWTMIPKSVYDDPEECNAHLNILLHGNRDEQSEPAWFTVSNRDYKLAAIRSKACAGGFERLIGENGDGSCHSEFEIGNHWIRHSKSKGSFLTISCHQEMICVSSFILGKLRAATYIRFDDLNDLPYFWLQYTGNLSWLKGLYDQILIYGYESWKVIDVLSPFWEDSASVVPMDSLDKMLVKSGEQSYSFGLEEVFPAVMLAVTGQANGEAG